MSVSELLLHFRSSIDREALIALEERDAYWSRENDALRANCHTLDVESRVHLHKTQCLEEELSKQTCMRKSLEEDIHRLAEKERWSQRKVRGLEMDVSDLRRAKNEELARVRNETADLEAKLREFERQLAKPKDSVRNIDLLKKEKGDFEHALKPVKSEENDQIDRSLNVKTRAVKQRILRRIQVLEREKKELQAEVCHVKREKSDEMALEAEKRRSEELNQKIEVLEKEKGGIEAELCKTKSEKSTEIEMILKEKMTLQVQNRRIEEEMKGKISELATKNEVLEREKGEIEAELCQALSEKIALGGHKSRMEAELKGKISELVSKIGVLEKEKGQHNTEFESIKKVKIALEVEKRRAEECVKVLEKGKTALEAEFSKYKKERWLAMKQKNTLMKKITQEKTTLEDEKRKVEEESDKKISELVRRTQVLVRERDDMEAESCKAKKHKINESERISQLKEALEDQKSRMEEAEKHVSEILKTIGVLEREKEATDAKDKEKSEEIKRVLKEKMDLEAEKRTTDDKHKKKVLELFQMIEVLKREKVEMGAKFCQANKENSEEIERILKEKMDLEVEMRTLKEEDKKKILELNHMIEVLKREMTEMETKFYQASKVQNEEIKRILNENIAMKAEKKASEEDAEKILELADRIGILEKEKRGLEEEIMQKDEVIQVLAQENDSLEDMKKKLKMEIDGLASKLKKDVKLFQPVHHPSNVDMLRTPLQNEGQKYFGGCKRKRTNADACKHKRHLSEDCIRYASSHVSENLASCRRRAHKIWEVDQDLLDSFDGDPELCLEAICALYRQHKLLLSSKPTNTNLSLGERGSKPDYSSKVIALAEYLIDEDPEGRMKKSVAELEQLDPVAVGECIDIAKQHYKQVFEIYKKKEDPFFLT